MSKLKIVGLWAGTLLFLQIAAINCPPAIANDFDEVNKLMDVGNYSAARPALRAMVKRYPKETILFVWLAKAYANDPENLREGFAKAGQCLKHAQELDPELGKVYTQYSEWYSAQGDYAKSIEMATKALKVKKPDYSAYEERAHSYNSIKKDKEAIADIEKAVKHVSRVNPRRWRKVMLSKASILENAGLYERALTDYEAILKQSYEDSIVYREIKCYERMNRLDDAIKLASSLIKNNPEDDAVYQMRARIYTKQKRYDDAASDYTKAYEYLPTPSILRERAKVYDLMGRKDLASKDRARANKD